MITENIQNELTYYKLNYNLVKNELIKLKHSYFKKFQKEIEILNHTFVLTQRNMIYNIQSVKNDLVIFIMIGIFLLLIVQLILYYKNFIKILKSLLDLFFNQLSK